MIEGAGFDALGKLVNGLTGRVMWVAVEMLQSNGCVPPITPGYDYFQVAKEEVRQVSTGQSQPSPTWLTSPGHLSADNAQNNLGCSWLGPDLMLFQGEKVFKDNPLLFCDWLQADCGAIYLMTASGARGSNEGAMIAGNLWLKGETIPSLDIGTLDSLDFSLKWKLLNAVYLYLEQKHLI